MALDGMPLPRQTIAADTYALRQAAQHKLTALANELFDSPSPIWIANTEIRATLIKAHH